jgi:hypothetical protein
MACPARGSCRIISALIVVLWIKLPLGSAARALAGVLGLVLIAVYLTQLAAMCTLLTRRHHGRSMWEIASALLLSLQWLEPFDDGADSESKGGKDDGGTAAGG